MILNYLKLSFRLLTRDPFFTVINIVGLGIGFASFYTLWEYSYAELKADQYHKDSERIARIGVDWKWTDDGGKTWGSIIGGTTVSSMIPMVYENHPEVESGLRILNQKLFIPSLVDHGNKTILSTLNQSEQSLVFKEENIAYSDSNLFTFFTIPLVHGLPERVLSEPNNVVLSQSTAQKYFGNQDPTGELLKLNDSTTLIVSGVFEDLPHYTHLNFDMVISNTRLQNKWNASPGRWNGWITFYIKLKSPNFAVLETKFNERAEEYFAEALRTYPNAKPELFIQPLAEIPFSKNFLNDNFLSKSKSFLLTLMFIALSVFAMAWINYINLSVSRITRRHKEIATRKVSGASILNLSVQFVTEAFATYILAITLAFTLIQIIRKPFLHLFNISITEFTALSSESLSILLTILISGIILSGIYPAIISLAYKPREIFNLKLSGSDKSLLPSLLTTSQLTVAMVFILLGFVVFFQLNYVLNLNIGINKNEVIVIEGPVVKASSNNSNWHSFKNQISSNSSILDVTNSSVDITEFETLEVAVVRRIGADLSYGIPGSTVDEYFVPFYGIKILAGRNFLADDRPEVILISRFAAKRLGYKSPEEAVGSKINLFLELEDWRVAEVIGVFENFRVHSFLNESNTEANNEGAGFILMNGNHSFGDLPVGLDKLSIRISTTNFEETITTIQELYEERFPGNPFVWYFLDERSNKKYNNEKTARNQIILFTGLAILIACMGLLGMILNKVTARTKEIGIRKVLGAGLYQIAHILLNTTIKQLALAIVIGIPLGYYLAHQYLAKYSERISLQWWHFVLPVLILVVIIFATIASSLWKAAKSNPVDSLKYE